MLVSVVSIVLGVCAFYVAVGIFAAVFLHLWGLQTLDSGVRDAGWFFRVLITPGLIALWPLMLMKWRIASSGENPAGMVDRPITPRRIRAIHRRTFVVLAILLPASILVAVAFRTNPVIESPEARQRLNRYEPLPEVLLSVEKPFPDNPSLPIIFRIRGNSEGKRQLEVEVSQDLPHSAVVLLWSPGTPGDSLDGSEVFFGAIWGPHTQRFELSPIIQATGYWVLYSMSERRILATTPVHRGGAD